MIVEKHMVPSIFVSVYSEIIFWNRDHIVKMSFLEFSSLFKLQIVFVNKYAEDWKTVSSKVTIDMWSRFPMSTWMPFHSQYFVFPLGYKKSNSTVNENQALRKKCPYSEFFWSVFSCIRTEYGEILNSISIKMIMVMNWFYCLRDQSKSSRPHVSFRNITRKDCLLRTFRNCNL